jgi:hypothetical protein
VRLFVLKLPRLARVVAHLTKGPDHHAVLAALALGKVKPFRDDRGMVSGSSEARHLLSPYDDKLQSDERESGVRQWQGDLWKEIIRSLRSANPLEVRLDWRPELGHPAVSQYTASTPDLLARFKDFNRHKPYAQRVKPFNFLLEFYGKRPDEMARQGLLKSTDDVKRHPSRARRITVIHTNRCLESAIGLLASRSDKNGYTPTLKRCAASATASR